MIKEKPFFSVTLGTVKVSRCTQEKEVKKRKKKSIINDNFSSCSVLWLIKKIEFCHRMENFHPWICLHIPRYLDVRFKVCKKISPNLKISKTFSMLGFFIFFFFQKKKKKSYALTFLSTYQILWLFQVFQVAWEPWLMLCIKSSNIYICTEKSDQKLKTCYVKRLYDYHLSC